MLIFQSRKLQQLRGAPGAAWLLVGTAVLAEDLEDVALLSP